MYSYEIDQVIKSQNYNIDSKTYINICNTIPQISQIIYTSFENMFEFWTSDKYYWKFKT